MFVSAAGGGGVPEGVWIALLGLVGVVLTALLTYFVSKRVNSGSIGTSAAADLWQESQAMRKELRDETVDLRGQLEKLQAEFADARTREGECKESLQAMATKMAKMEGKLAVLEKKQ